MYMLREIGQVDRVDTYIRGAINAKKKIMGFGHRVYKADDPARPGCSGSRTIWPSPGQPQEMSERIRVLVQD